MAETEQHIQVGELNVSYGDVLLRTQTTSGDSNLDSLQRDELSELLVVYEIPNGQRRVLASAVGNIYPQGNRFSIPAIHLTSAFFRKLKP